jgi:hypothetical protein
VGLRGADGVLRHGAGGPLWPVHAGAVPRPPGRDRRVGQEPEGAHLAAAGGYGGHGPAALPGPAPRRASTPWSNTTGRRS